MDVAQTDSERGDAGAGYSRDGQTAGGDSEDTVVRQPNARRRDDGDNEDTVIRSGVRAVGHGDDEVTVVRPRTGTATHDEAADDEATVVHGSRPAHPDATIVRGTHARGDSEDTIVRGGGVSDSPRDTVVRGPRASRASTSTVVPTVGTAAGFTRVAFIPPAQSTRPRESYKVRTLPPVRSRAENVSRVAQPIHASGSAAGDRAHIVREGSAARTRLVIGAMTIGVIVIVAIVGIVVLLTV